MAHENKSFLTTAKCLLPGGGATNHVVPFQKSLLAAHKGVYKGTLIDDSVWPEENDILRRFLSDEGAAFTLLCFLKIDEYASKASARVSAPFASGR